MRLLAITDRFALPGQHTPGQLSVEERRALRSRVRVWAAGGVGWIQLREKDLPEAALLGLARELAGELAEAARGSPRARLLLNGPLHLALASGADGVHLPGGWSVEDVKAARAALQERPLSEPDRASLVSVACHTTAEGTLAREAGADLALFAPVFDKPVRRGALDAETLPGRGLPALASCCAAAAPVPVFALGGVDADNASDCLRAGAQGVAGIGLFLTEHWRRLAG